MYNFMGVLEDGTNFFIPGCSLVSWEDFYHIEDRSGHVIFAVKKEKVAQIRREDNE